VNVCILLLPGAAFTQDQFFDSDGVKIRYTDHGTGEPVVLVHGFTGTLERWSETGVQQKLAKDFRVITLDCRGHGRSDKPHDPEAYGAEMAEDVIRLLDYLGIDKAHLVGYSMGARLTAYLLANKPERLITATLGASRPRLSLAGLQERAKRFVAYIEKQARADSSGGQDYIALAAIPLSWSDQIVEESKLITSTVPTQAIIGSEDPRLSGMKTLKDLMPALKLVIIDGATHAGEESAMGRPEFVDTVHEFLTAHRQQ